MARSQMGPATSSSGPAGSSVHEAELASRALERTARRLGALLDRERALTSTISHQIRTPLTALRLGLERALLAPPADPDPAEPIQTALDRIDRIETTVSDLLSRARDTLPPLEPTDLAAGRPAARRPAFPASHRGGPGAPAAPHEFDLLTSLATTAGQALPREQLMSEVWDEYWSGSTKTLDTHVMALRRKLAAAGLTGDTITTLRGYGYRYVPPDQPTNNG